MHCKLKSRLISTCRFRIYTQNLFVNNKFVHIRYPIFYYLINKSINEHLIESQKFSFFTKDYCLLSIFQYFNPHHQWRIQESLVGGDINPAGGLGGAISPPVGSRGEAPGHPTNCNFMCIVQIAIRPHASKLKMVREN